MTTGYTGVGYHRMTYGDRKEALSHPLAREMCDFAKQKQSNLVLAPKKATFLEVIELVQQVGGEIVGLQIDPGTFSDFSAAVIRTLEEVCKKKRIILLIHSGDFGHAGTIRLVEVAACQTALFVANGDWFNRLHHAQTRLDTIVGYVAKLTLGDPRLLAFSSYQSDDPKKAVFHDAADFVLVGDSACNVPDPVLAVRQCRIQLWNFHNEACRQRLFYRNAFLVGGGPIAGTPRRDE